MPISKNKLIALETQAKLLGDQKTTVIAPNAPAPAIGEPAPIQNTVVQGAQPRSNGMKQILMMLLMAMMKPQSAQIPVSAYSNPLMGSALQPSNPLLGANPAFAGSSLYGGNALASAFAPQATQLSAYGGYGAGLYGGVNPLQF